MANIETLAKLALFALCVLSEDGLSRLVHRQAHFVAQPVHEVESMTVEKNQNGDITSAAEATAASAAPHPFYRRLWFRIILYLAAAYVVWCAILYFRQDGMLFMPDMTERPRLAQPANAVLTRMEIEGGEFVESWFFPVPSASADTPAPVVIFFHGNAEIIDFQDPIVRGYRDMGWSVLLPEFRGYGRSAGKPSQEAIVADAVRFYDQLIQDKGVDKSRIVFHGRSLGGGVAADLASGRRPCALILESTFASVASMAHKYCAPPFLVKNPFRTDRVVADLDIPILIMHGAGDHIIPVSHVRRLRDLSRRATYVEFDCGHNDFPGTGNEETYWAAVRDFISKANVIP